MSPASTSGRATEGARTNATGATRAANAAEAAHESAELDQPSGAKAGHHPVRIARNATGFTQETLAAAVGVTRQTVISIESGDYAPSVVLALRIARCVKASVEDLWGPAADASPP